jgi:tetratricopeptide (TPR) repeat protein
MTLRKVDEMRKRIRILLALLAASLPAAAGAQPAELAAVQPAEIWRQIENARLDVGRAVAVENLKLKAGLAEFHIEEGVVFLATPVGGRPVEMVFTGRARLRLEAPDDVEAGQLELFTDRPSLDERVSEAVLAVAFDAASDNLAARPAVGGLDAAAVRRAEELFQHWKERPERRLLGVDAGIFRDAVGDPLYTGFFAGWFRGEELGEFLYLFEPDAGEQVTLGKFQRLEATEKERRKLSRQLHRAQRRGRLIGLEVDDLGRWDTWLSSSMPGGDGAPRRGFPSFEPRHYQLEISLGDKLELDGRAAIVLRTLAKPARVVKLDIHSDLAIERVAVDGEELFFRQSRNEALVVLPERYATVDELVLEVAYSGKLIEKGDSKTWVLLDTTHWYPHTGEVDLATYDLTFEWPAKLDLLSGGRKVDGGDKDGRRWQRFEIDKPTFAVSFEVGKFRTVTARAGHVDVTLAFDALGHSVLDRDSRDALLATVRDALLYFEEVFGPYPLDEITVVTAPREFSQSLLGFVTLSTLNVLDVSWVSLVLGLEDRRTVIAHEIAHQWWGHMVAWQGYRDQWISEAMANYAAVLYARHRLSEPLAIGPTTGWQRMLTAVTDDGRPIESIGPLVLGERLVSSRTGKAYEAIVYKKGAVVLDMLARRFGEETFLKILSNLAQAVSFRPISTPVFLELIERSSTVDLDGFARQFVYGTGLPVVYYSYELAPLDDGLWQVTATARQQSPYRYTYHLVERDGALDVGRRRLEQIEVESSSLVVPVQIAVYDPSAPLSQTMKQLEIDPREIGNAFLKTHMLLDGETSELQVKVAYEPKRLFLDREKEVFGRFFSERKSTKQRLFAEALDRLVEGRLEEAESGLRAALAAAVETAPASGDAAEIEDRLGEDDVLVLDGRIHLELGRLYLDQGRVAAARQAFDQVEERVTRATEYYLEVPLEIQEARLAIVQRDYDQAYKLLKKLRRGKVDSTEGQLLLAIAARETGRLDEHQEAVAAATLRGADVSALKLVPASPAASGR